MQLLFGFNSASIHAYGSQAESNFDQKISYECEGANTFNIYDAHGIKKLQRIADTTKTFSGNNIWMGTNSTFCRYF